MADQLLDAKGLNCPLPILRAKKALKDVAMGGTLEVLATDPGAVKDFEAFCRATGNELLASNVEGKVYRLRHQAPVVGRGAGRHGRVDLDLAGHSGPGCICREQVLYATEYRRPSNNFHEPAPLAFVAERSF
jgi:tRNA 2-thiouridine synthesizing protein A